MNSMEYEMDSMGGLMPQIMALTSPPGTRDLSRQSHMQSGTSNHLNNPAMTNGNPQTPKLSISQSSKPQEAGLAAHPYFKRPGRGHNHDCCDSCGEGGDLICCDLCPASFHLTCHDPPLDEEELPVGEWACHQCRMTGNNNSNSTLRLSRNPKNGSKKKDKEENESKVFAGGRELEISNTPLTTLIKAAAVVNPKQFKLPFELTLPANFPGEPKEQMKRNGSRRGSSKKKPYELDNGLVPLPAKLCFQCSKSCRVGPLIPCDYCPLLFHLDCLDPPLTVPPMGRWMCPTHPEHTMDMNKLTSHSLTERVKLWDKFVPPIDQHTVKLDFLQRCHRMNPPFRYKIKKALRSRLRVPASIKAHYKDPPDLLPHLSPSHYVPLLPPVESATPNSAVLDSAFSSINLMATSASSLPGSDSRNDTTSSSDEKSTVVSEIKQKKLPAEASENSLLLDSLASGPQSQDALDDGCTVEEMDVDPLPTKDEKEQWLSSILSLHVDIIKHMSSSSVASPGEKDKCNGPNESPPQAEPRPSCLNGDVVSHESRFGKFHLDGAKNAYSRLDGHLHDSQSSLYYSGSKRGGIFKAQKGKISSAPILKTSRQKRASPSHLLMDALSSLSLSLKDKIKGNHGISLSNLDRTIIDILACERLEQVMSPSSPDPVISNPLLPARALLCPLRPDIKLKDLAPKKKYSMKPVPMTFRILTIGKGSHNHVNLEDYGHCNYISSHHASIIFDECTGFYELLNYSEYATKVDGISYFSSFSEKTVSQAAPPPFLQQVKAIIAQRRGVRPCDKMPSPPPAMNSCPGQEMIRCQCKQGKLTSVDEPTSTGSRNLAATLSGGATNASDQSDSEPFSGWEGAAVLHHGSYMRFGCLQFVFSIVEEASKGNWAEDTLITYEKFIKKNDEERESEVKVKEEKEDSPEKEKEGKEKDVKEKEKRNKKEDSKS